MTRKSFLVFTIIMVCISAAAFYGIYTRAGNQLKSKSPSIVARLPEEDPPFEPLSEATQTELRSAEEEGSAIKTLTNGQKYHTALISPESRNVLLIGKDPTYSNFDILLIVSVDETNKSVRVVDLPRDIYIDYAPPILGQLEKNALEFYQEKGSRKLNAAPVVGRKLQYSPETERFAGKKDINFLSDLIHEIFEISIDDYMSVETDGFREMVDYFGGVVVDVPYPMHYEDPLQDLYIHLEPGLQVLDGTQAEGFVRFRQGYNEDGRMVSYSRAENTFLFLRSFFKQHVTLRNLAKAGKVYEIVRKNTSTSVQTLGDNYQYVRLLKEILEDGYTIESVAVQCVDTKNIDGALYDIIRTK